MESFLISNKSSSNAEEVRYCKSYDSAAKAEKLVALTPDMESYYDHLMEWSV